MGAAQSFTQMNDWKQPASNLIYWDGPVDWRLYERAIFPSPIGVTKVEVRKGLYKKLNRKAVSAASLEEANCARVAVKMWKGKFEDQFFLIRPRQDEGELGVSKEISRVLPHSQGDSPEEKWRREYISILRKKKQILEEVRPGAVDYSFYRTGGEWHVQYSCHWEVEEVPALMQIEEDLGNLRGTFPRKESGMAAFEDWLGERCF